MNENGAVQVRKRKAFLKPKVCAELVDELRKYWEQTDNGKVNLAKLSDLAEQITSKLGVAITSEHIRRWAVAIPGIQFSRKRGRRKQGVPTSVKIAELSARLKIAEQRAEEALRLANEALDAVKRPAAGDLAQIAG